MNSNFLIDVMGIAALILIYLAMKTIKGKGSEVSYHTVERILVFGLAAVLVVVAIVID